VAACRYETNDDTDISFSSDMFLHTCSRCRRAASAPEEVRGWRTWHIETRSILGNGKSLLGLVCAAGVPASDRHERPTPSTLRAAIRVRHVACRKAVRRVLRNNCHPFLSPILPLIRRASESSLFRPLPMGEMSWRRCPPTTSATGGSRVRWSVVRQRCCRQRVRQGEIS
jgi:hypothetical protein